MNTIFPAYSFVLVLAGLTPLRLISRGPAIEIGKKDIVELKKNIYYVK